MPGYLECGVIDDSPLHMIDQALTYVRLELLFKIKWFLLTNIM